MKAAKLTPMQHQPSQRYTCPMHPEVVKDGPGKCPKCGMNLVRVGAEIQTGYASNQPDALKDNLDKTARYYCPMHCEGEKEYPQPGDCPVCGMHLVKVGEPVRAHVHPMPPIRKKAAMGSSGSGDEYYCPMLCEG